ncbi:MAG TPA: four-helix bundle copper-binding protein [Micavibrio sp.]
MTMQRTSPGNLSQTHSHTPNPTQVYGHDEYHDPAHCTHDPMAHCKHTAWSCRDTCQRTLFKHCLQMGDQHVAEEHVKLMMDCIDICQLTADFITRCSVNHTSVCQTCADICEKCAASCEAIGGDHMIACAEACRKCAGTCHEMAQGEMLKAKPV